MSRGSQLFWFLNAGKPPSALEARLYYTAIEITSELKHERAGYRKRAGLVGVRKKSGQKTLSLF